MFTAPSFRRPFSIITAIIIVVVVFASCQNSTIPPIAGSVSVSLTLSGTSDEGPYLQNVTFNEIDTSVTLNVASSVTAIDVELTSELSSATLNVDGTSLASGLKVTLSLDVGKNIFPVSITPEGGNTINYILNITRAEPPVLSDDAGLSDLELSIGAIAPVFTSSNLAYTSSVSAATASVTVTPTANDPAASISTNGTANISGTSSSSIILLTGVNVITVVVTAEDGVSTETYTISVTRLETEDETNPTIVLNGATTVTIEVNTSFEEPGYSASDPEEGDLTSVVVFSGSIVTDDVVDTSEIGTFTLNYDVADTSGNTAETVSRTLTIEDTTPPEIELLGDNPMYVEFDSIFSDPGATVTDNYDADYTIYSSDSIDTSTEGEQTLTYNVDDSEGNSAATESRTVVVGAEPLELGDFYRWHGDEMDEYLFFSFFDGGYTVSSDKNGQISGGTIEAWNNSTNQAVFEHASGYWRLDWTEPVDNVFSVTEFGPPVTSAAEAWALSDGSDSFTSYYSLADVPPVLLVNGDDPLEIEYGSEFSDPGVEVGDWGDSSPTVYAENPEDVDTVVPGDYLLHYNYTDDDGHSAEFFRTVTVLAQEPIELDDLYYFWDDEWYTGYMYQSSVDNAFTVVWNDLTEIDDGTYIEYDNEVNEAIGYSNVTLLYYRVIWSEPVDNVCTMSYSVGFGNIEDARTASTDDVTLTCYTQASAVPPVIILEGEALVEMEIDTIFSDPGATVYDWGVADDSIMASNPEVILSNTLGTYTITYTSSDGINDAVPVTRDVEVIAAQDSIELTDVYRIDIYSDGEYLHIELNDSTYSVTTQTSGVVDSGTVEEYDNSENVAILYSTPQDAFYRVEWTDAVDGVFTQTDVGPFSSVGEARAGTAGGGSYTSYSTAEDVPPLLLLIGDDPVTLTVGEAFTDEGATLVDWGDENSIIYATDLDGLNELDPASGTYTLEYTATDSDLNVAVPVTRTVVVGSGVAEIIIQ